MEAPTSTGRTSASFGTILFPGQKFEVKVTAEFSGSKYGKLTNFVISKIYNLRKEAKSSPAYADVYAMKQNIAVTKTPDITVGAPDTVVNYTLLVQNTGNISLNNVFVSDILPEKMSYAPPLPEGLIVDRTSTGRISALWQLDPQRSFG